MPGPGGRGGRGRGGRRVGFRHAPLRPAPPPPGLFFAGAGLRPAYRERGGGRPLGPRGVSCCCWTWICVIAFVLVSSVGISLIDWLAGCKNVAAASGPDGDGDDGSSSTCFDYEVGFAVCVGVVALCFCCCLMHPSDGGYQPIDETEAERQHMLATEAAPLPLVHGDPTPLRYQSIPTGSAYQTEV